MTKYIQKYRFYSFKVSESLDKQIFDKYFGLGLTDSNHLKISHLLKTIIDDDDDVKLLAPLTEKNGFSRYNSINFNELPCVESQLSLLEACCYYGSVNCFKFLRTKFSAEITELCLQLSFLGGNPDIMSECLKCHKPDKKCMKYAIMSHNIDFVTYLMNEHNLKIKVRYCIKYDNIQAFLIRYDQTNDIEDFIVQTSDYPYVWKTIFSNLTEFDEDYHGLLYTAKFIAHHNFYYDNKDDYHFKDDSGKNILHYIAMYFTGIDIEYIGCPKVRLAQRSI
ncbi:hypothetical protein TVAG_135690 [Trichomonas vaginalis G3]|uniref:DUF3447 domain-containing protein n=1 Tax=Trichomonas vaginalis (strain ATCC PRA-98 / G3) TaxID=412133 RepID=A2G7I9_TRIV3|nr:hypothetical protein TVAG_135690 [Trichomonas vaginalis G3]|eukprot:XP_001299809.1 hypothetical protein [Trichomonas vaginalis G3]